MFTKSLEEPFESYPGRRLDAYTIKIDNQRDRLLDLRLPASRSLARLLSARFLTRNRPTQILLSEGGRGGSLRLKYLSIETPP